MGSAPGFPLYRQGFLVMGDDWVLPAVCMSVDGVCVCVCVPSSQLFLIIGHGLESQKKDFNLEGMRLVAVYGLVCTTFM